MNSYVSCTVLQEKNKKIHFQYIIVYKPQNEPVNCIAIATIYKDSTIININICIYYTFYQNSNELLTSINTDKLTYF